MRENKENNANTTKKDLPNYYAIIPATVRYCRELSAQEKLLYGEITALSNLKGYCWATNNYFARVYSLSKSAISHQISNLAKHGFITVELIYAEGSKQIQERRIYLANSDIHRVISDLEEGGGDSASTPVAEISDTPISDFSDTPIVEICKDNSTSLNTIKDNTKTRKRKKEDFAIYGEPSMSKSSSLSNLKNLTDKTTDTDNDFDSLSNRLTAIEEAIERLINHSFPKPLSSGEKNGGSAKKREAEDEAEPESSSPAQLANNTKKREPNPEEAVPFYGYDETREIIREKIDYSHFKKHESHRAVNIQLIDELVTCMLDVICTRKPTVMINRELKNRNAVIRTYLSLNSADIQHVIAKYEEQRGKITHVNAYLKTMLYTVKQENNFFYTNAVRAEGFV